MILIDNRDVLRLRNRELLNRLSALEENTEESSLIIEQSRTGVPTLKLNVDGKAQYVHSKYDPEKEAERLISQLEGIENSNHILFVGCGLGYHIKEFTERYPNLKFSIYEPDVEVLISYLSIQKLSDLPLNNLGKIFTGKEESKMLKEVTAILESSNSMLRIYTLPIYEKIYGSQVDTIMEKALESLKAKRNNLTTNAAFQKRWTINSIKNFPLLLKTPNILHDVDKSVFEGKPAIIVAAGPSLNEEFENLRYIKENGLAYIFSVGSAINALIEQNIYPDAACTYDPQDINYRVIQIIKDKQLNEIPLIFGSSVGFETLENYPGKMLHMIVSQDTVSPALLKHKHSKIIGYVNDAPSIAVITFQLLSKLGFKKIILVGQNLAYAGNKHYVKGIEQGSRTNEITEETLGDAPIIKDVNGMDIRTTEGFNNMRTQLEMYIAHSTNVEVINTTVRGANIQGARYMRLTEVIEQQLNKFVVSTEWMDGKNAYDYIYVEERLAKLEVEMKNLEKIINNGLFIVEKINRGVKLRKLARLEISYIQLDKEIDRIRGNLFYKAFIEPMIRVQYERLTQAIQSVRFDKNPYGKGKTIGHEFLAFLTECSINYELSVKLCHEMKSKIEK